MTLERLKILNHLRTRKPWRVEHRNVFFYDAKTDLQIDPVPIEKIEEYVKSGREGHLGADVIGPDVPDRSSFTASDAHFIAEVANSFDALIAVADASREILTSISKVYSGFPGKLEWPEIHYLRQTLEQLDSEET